MLFVGFRFHQMILGSLGGGGRGREDEWVDGWKDDGGSRNRNQDLRPVRSSNVNTVELCACAK